ncbi:MAG TPA: prepilin-type N-terminal cleavage/methylation domain-containing protein [Gammaproteobacteria bacterium]|nr:prepilin-type N-terminal cleavage/methylation domain-containing protein [Gammaproteobacteria bacterium]
MNKIKGFTLIEVSLVLLIVAFTLGSLLLPLGSKLEEKSINETKVQLADIKQAIINFTLSNSRLPCPDINSDGVEDLSSTSCSSNAGTIAYVTLNSPHKHDPWGQAFIYRVTGEFADTVDGTTCSTNAKKNVSIDLCSAADGDINVLDYDLNSASTVPAANGLVAIVLSTGRPSGAISIAESENTNNDNVFFKTGYGGVNSTMPFNDIVVWVSSTEIIGELIKARVLP